MNRMSEYEIKYYVIRMTAVLLFRGIMHTLRILQKTIKKINVNVELVR